MGKQRRLEKLARRKTENELEQRARLSWTKIVRLIAKALAFAALGTVLQLVLVALNIQFFRTIWGQLMIFALLYIVMYRWINAEFMAMRDARVASTKSQKLS